MPLETFNFISPLTFHSLEAVLSPELLIWEPVVRNTSLVAVIAILCGLGYWFISPHLGTQKQRMPMGNSIVVVQLPQDFSEQALIGQSKFEANCAACHGTNAAGKDGIAPPLIHIIYEPNHHGDESFQLAVAQGVRQHHWPFGDMQPVQGLSRDDVGSIIAYVRELQRANGIN